MPKFSLSDRTAKPLNTTFDAALDALTPDQLEQVVGDFTFGVGAFGTSGGSNGSGHHHHGHHQRHDCHLSRR